MKVTLRMRAQKTGRITLYLDYYPPIIHPESGKYTRWEHLKLFLYNPPRDEIEKRHNREVETIARTIAANRHLDRISGKFGLKRSSMSEDFLAYYLKHTEKLTSGKSNRDGWLASYKTLEIFCKGNCTFGDLTPELVNNYKEFLLKKATRIHSPGLRISQNTAYSYFNKFKACVRQAFVHGLLSRNPCDLVKGIGQPETYREFLSKEELLTLYRTPCDSDELKRSCLFSALTGMRMGDVNDIRWDQVQSSESLGHYLRFRQGKSQRLETLPLSDEAVSLLGTPGEPGDKVWGQYNFRLCYSELERWIMRAGIRKKITFHNFRHTFATLQLAEGTDIYTVSKLLGHRNVQTTQIYGKVIDATKSRAMRTVRIGLDGSQPDT
jgi:integrase